MSLNLCQLVSPNMTVRSSHYLASRSGTRHQNLFARSQTSVPYIQSCWTRRPVLLFRAKRPNGQICGCDAQWGRNSRAGHKNVSVESLRELWIKTENCSLIYLDRRKLSHIIHSHPLRSSWLWKTAEDGRGFGGFLQMICCGQTFTSYDIDRHQPDCQLGLRLDVSLCQEVEPDSVPHQ